MKRGVLFRCMILSLGALLALPLSGLLSRAHGAEFLEGHEVDSSASVDLSNQFLKRVTRQQGDHCSIHATAALVEAACFVKTGRRIDLSEASLIADHLRFYLKQPYRPTPYFVSDTWLKPNRDELMFSVFSEIPNHHHASVLSPSGISLTGFDSAYPRQVLTQILIGNVLSEAELPTDAGFFEKIGSWVKSWGPQETGTNHNDVRLGAVRDLDQRVLGHAQEGGTHFRYQSASSVMSDCLSDGKLRVVSGPGQYAIERKNPDGSKSFERKIVNAPRVEDLMGYLDQSHAVGCLINRYAFDLGDRVQTGSHMVVVVGYRKTADKGVEFRVRDSNFESHMWLSLTGCDEFLVVK